MKKRVLFVNDEMVMGGVARILITMLNKIDQSKFEVDVLILHAHGELLAELPQWVNVIKGTTFFKAVDINLKQALQSYQYKAVFDKLFMLSLMKLGLIESQIIKQRKILRCDENPYDVEIAAKEGFCTLFVSCGKSKRKLNWIHVDYSAQNYSTHHMRLMKKAITKMDLNMAVSLKAAQAYKDLFHAFPTITINNPIDIDDLRLKTQEKVDFSCDKNYINLITVARFHPQKAVDRLMNAVRDNIHKYPQIRCYIIGSGDLESQLKNLVTQYQLNEQIIFLGQKKNPMPYIKQADLFVLSSLYEGYPTTVIESLIAQTPVLSTDVSGVHEQLIENETGWIVENSKEALSQKLDELLADVKHLREIKESLKSYSYSNEHIIEQFESALLGKSA